MAKVQYYSVIRVLHGLEPYKLIARYLDLRSCIAEQIVLLTKSRYAKSPSRNNIAMAAHRKYFRKGSCGRMAFFLKIIIVK